MEEGIHRQVRRFIFWKILYFARNCPHDKASTFIVDRILAIQLQRHVNNVTELAAAASLCRSLLVTSSPNLKGRNLAFIVLEFRYFLMTTTDPILQHTSAFRQTPNSEKEKIECRRTFSKRGVTLG